MSEEVEIEEIEGVIIEVDIRIRKGVIITIVKKETLILEVDINQEATIAVEITEAIEATVAIAEVDIKITEISTIKTKIVIKMKISLINNSIQIHRNSNKKIKETSRSSKEIVAVVAAAIRKIMIITVAETEEEMTNNSSIILDQGEAMAKINIKTTTTIIIKTMMEATIRSIETLKRIRLTMSSKGILKKIRISLRITVTTIRIIRNKFEDKKLKQIKKVFKNKKIMK